MIAVVLAALADPTRQRLLDALVDAGRANATTLAGRANATTLAGRLPVSPTGSGQAPAAPLDCRSGRRVRTGREVLYATQPGPLDASARWLLDLSAAWDLRLNALKGVAEAASGD